MKARASDPITSHEAAASVYMTEGQRIVLRALLTIGPMPDEELVASVNLSPSGARSRRAELVSMGLVEDSGETAVTSTGRRAIVWRAAGKPPVAQASEMWKCMTCKTILMALPPDTTSSPGIRSGRCYGCGGARSFFKAFASQ